MTKIRAPLVVLLLALATGVAYFNSLHNNFVWDDNILVVENSRIRNASYITSAFTTDLFCDYRVESATHYRPIQLLSYMLDYAQDGLNTFPYHLTNILLHLLCAILVWRLAEHLTGNRNAALAVASLFAVHPINTNAITYIAGRADPLAFAGMLGCLLFFIAYRNQPNILRYLAAVCCAVFALFSRESAMLLPALLLLYALLIGRQRSWRAALPFILLVIAFAFWRHEVLAAQNKPLPATFALTIVDRIQIPFRSLATYIGLIFWPANLQMERQLIVGGVFLHILTAAGILTLLALTALTLWSRRHCRVTFFGLCWLGITLSPLLGILNLNANVAEHWLYVPSFGFYLAAAAICLRLPANIRRWLPIATIFVVAALAARTIRRNQDWATPESIFAATQRSAPLSFAARSNLGQRLLSKGQHGQALAELRAAATINPQSPRAQSNLAALYLALHDLVNARARVEASLRLSPGNVPALLQLAAITEQQGDRLATRRAYIRALGHTTAVPPRLQFGSFLVRTSRLLEARSVAEEIIISEPGNAKAWNLLGAIQVESKEYREAEKSFNKAASLDRFSPDAHINLGRLALRLGDLPSATQHLERAVRLRPDDSLARYQLALAYWRDGKLELAESELKEALLLAPGSIPLSKALQKLQHREGAPEVPPN